MCCSKRKQQRHFALQQQLFFQPQIQSRHRGCCGARRQRGLLEAAAVDAQNHLQVSEIAQPGYFEPNQRAQRPTMAAMIAVGIGLGAEKLGRKISEKRLERKEKRTAAEQEAIYGTAGSSTAGAVQHRDESKSNRKYRKSEEARREQEHVNRRRSVSEERVSGEEPPPRYEDVVRQDIRQV
ncbi:Nn.00g004340.m01.CDS01 [Neocucurbitaria sp. VM-36]